MRNLNHPNVYKVDKRSCNFKNLIGLKFERLLVLEDTMHNADKLRGIPIWKCICDCGTYAFVRADRLRQSLTKSCGCLQKEKASASGEKLIKEGTAQRNLFRNYERRCKLKGLAWELTLVEALRLFSMNCFYCTDPPVSVSKAKSGVNFIYNGLDRIDSSIGYIKGNVVPCCEFCNYAKMDNSVEFFLTKVEKIYKWMIESEPIKSINM